MNSAYPLRPMDLRDILDETFELYKNNVVLFLTIAAVVFLPLQLVMTMLTGAPPTIASQVDPRVFVSGPFIRYGAMVLVSIVLGTLGRLLAVGALSEAVSERYLGRRMTAQEAYGAIWARFGAFLTTLLLTFALVFGALILFGIAVALVIGVLFAVSSIAGTIVLVLLMLIAIPALIFCTFIFTFLVPVFVIEGRSGMDAVKRSFQLYMFNPFKVFFSMILIAFIIAFITGIVILPVTMTIAMMSPGGHPTPFLLALQGAMVGLGQSFMQPIQLIVTILLYFDVRIRREGFDLEMMANELRGESLGESQTEGPPDYGSPFPQGP